MSISYETTADVYLEGQNLIHFGFESSAAALKHNPVPPPKSNVEIANNLHPRALQLSPFGGVEISLPLLS